MTLTVFSPETSPRLRSVLEEALRGIPHEYMVNLDAFAGKKSVLFAFALDDTGVSPPLWSLLHYLRSHQDSLVGAIGGIVMDGTGELFTKGMARTLALAANYAGMALVGKPLVEATGTLLNFRVQAKIARVSLPEAYRLAIRGLIERILAGPPLKKTKTNLLALHASNRSTSNTLTLWGMVKGALSERVAVNEITLRNGSVADCVGCAYKTCMHFSEQGNCFYGGVMVDEVYPAVTASDGLILLCPNYNDALGANLSAFINRLTALFRKTPFYDKRLFGIVVSGYSGGDLVAEQLVSSLNMNKAFWLPPYFCMMETANDPGEIAAVPGILDRAAAFAGGIEKALIE